MHHSYVSDSSERSDDLEHLQAFAEDMSDILGAEAARAELRDEAAESVPWEQVKADLGLT